MKISVKSIFLSCWNWLVNIIRYYWSLNLEAKIGILFLIPPIIGVFYFVFNLFGAELGFESFPESWNCIYGSDYGSDSDSGCIWLGIWICSNASNTLIFGFNGNCGSLFNKRKSQ